MLASAIEVGDGGGAEGCVAVAGFATFIAAAILAEEPQSANPWRLDCQGPVPAARVYERVPITPGTKTMAGTRRLTESNSGPWMRTITGAALTCWTFKPP